MDIELKSYEDIAVLAQETAPNASGFGGRSLGLPGVQLPTEQQRDMRRAVRRPALHSHALQGRLLGDAAARPECTTAPQALRSCAPCCVLTRLVAGGMQYYAAVSHTDEQIGRVLDELRQSGLRKSTVVCFFT